MERNLRCEKRTAIGYRTGAREALLSDRKDEAVVELIDLSFEDQGSDVTLRFRAVMRDCLVVMCDRWDGLHREIRSWLVYADQDVESESYLSHIHRFTLQGVWISWGC